jgi:hypothetical protein
MQKTIQSLIAVGILASSAANAAEVNVPSATVGAEVTIYNSDLAMVREQRSFNLPATSAQLAFTGVSGRMQPETALLEVIKGDPIKIIEQNFKFNVINQRVLLEHAIGKDVTVILPNAVGVGTTMKARVLSADGPVFEIDGRIHTGLTGRIIFDSMPEGMRATPTLVLKVTGAPGKDSEAEFSYLTSGLTWHADYVVNYDADAARMNLTGWATILNTTGIDFNDAKLKLVAGDINRVYAPRPMAKEMRAINIATAAPMTDGVSEGEREGAHIYNIAHAVTLSEKESKQISLLSGRGVPVLRELIFRNNQPYIYSNIMRGQNIDSRAAIELSFRNDAKAKLNVALPAGAVRIYGMDDKGASQLLGESNIGHKAAGSEVRLSVGQDFDVTSLREQLTFVHASDNINVSAWRLTVKNAKSRAIKVRIIEPMPESWEITKESHPHKDADASATEWILDLPAKGQAVLEYNVKSVS